MRELLFGGIIYLTGVSIILIIKPSLFFNKEGSWKEFGIGRNPETYTWFPLWLFCIFWALVSYSMVYLLIRTVERPSNNMQFTKLLSTTDEPVSSINEAQRTMTNRSRRPQHRGLRRRLTPAEDYGNMRPGVYVMNEATSARKGIPHYIYYGQNDI
jgi:hypothetical protein